MTNEEIKKFKQGEELSLLVNFDSYTNDIKSIFYRKKKYMIIRG